jgi:serine/threonine protein kinase/Tfp pilus assembly protein PilF
LTIGASSLLFNTTTKASWEKGKMIDRTISHYKILDKLGEGGMGEVYLAEDTKLNRKVALKFLPSQAAVNKTFKERFKREAQAAAALNHPNIITIHEVSEHEGRPYIAMEYVEGQSLKGLIAKKDMTIRQVLDIAIQICEGLTKAHQQGIIHRDIKPQNILVDKDGRARILDFGLARLEREAMITRTGSTVGTVAYMSPEQARGERVDQRSDIFSLGVVLYEMITLRIPFRGEHEAAMMNSILSDTPEPLARYKSDIPQELQRIIDKALRKDMSTRYQSIADMMADLKQVQMETMTLSTEGVARTAKVSRTRPILVSGAILLALAIVIVGYLVLNRTPTTTPPGMERLDKLGWENSVAVLPFRDFSPDQDQEYFCDGMTDAIISKLSGLQGLKVISMSSVMRFKEPEQDIKEVAEELGVSTVLEGSIQKEDSRIRLSAQLINASDGSHLWSDTYDRELESVFAIQDEISQAIVGVLKIRLLGADRIAFTKRYTDNVEAYNAYTQGRFLWNKRTEENLMKAIEYFQTAVELDPKYALAYSGLADVYNVLPSNVGTPVEEVLPQAKEAANKALDLDDNLGEAHASLGLALSLEGDTLGAEKEYLTAIELNPAYAYAHYWYAMLLGRMGKHEESLRELETAYELDPLSVVILVYLATIRWESGDSLEALELVQRALEIEPARMATYSAFGSGLHMSGRLEDAITIYQRAIQIDPTYSNAYNRLCYIYNEMGDFKRALESADYYVQSLPDEPDAYDTRGDIYAYNGRLNKAIENYQHTVKIDPKFGSSLEKLFSSYLFNREYDKADSMARLTLQVDDVKIRAAVRSALILIPLYQGKYNLALKVADEGIAADRAEQEESWDWAHKHSIKFFIYLETEHLDLARGELEIIKELQETYRPDDPVRLRDVYAVVSALEGEYGQADELMRTWRADVDEENQEQMGNYWRMMGIVEFIKGNTQAAITHLRDHLYENSTPLFEIRYFLAQAHLESGQAEQATEVLEKALSRYDRYRAQYPTWSVKARYYLAQAYEQLGRTQEAVDQYKEFLEWWRDADPGIPEVEDAKERLEKLRVES